MQLLNQKSLFTLIGILICTISYSQSESKSIYFKLKKENFKKEIENVKRSTKSINNNLTSEQDQLENYPFLLPLLKNIDTKLTRPSYYGSVNELKSVFKLTFHSPQEIAKVLKEMKSLSQIDYAEAEPSHSITYFPMDELYSESSNSWYHDLISAESAWDYQLGSSNIKVAIIDNAIYLDHDDLSGDIGYDFAENESGSNPPFDGSIWSHGTHVAGLATANHNAIGMPSLGGAAKVMGAKCAPDNDMTNVINTFEAIQWACENGARVVSMSYAGDDYSQTLQDLFNSYPNVVFVAAAGNSGESAIQYPGGYDNVLCVGSVDSDDEISSFSNYNSDQNWVDVCAPGGHSNGGLLSTMYDDSNNNYYGKMGGTSMACPLTAGLCAMILATNPNLTGEEVRDCIINSGDPKPFNVGPRINALASVICASSGNILIPNFEANNTTNEPNSFINFTDLSSSIGENIVEWNWTFEGGTPSTSTEQYPSILYETEGTFDVSLTVSNESGETETIILPDYINISICGLVIISIIPDQYGSETTWEIRDENNEIVYSGGPYTNNNEEEIIVSICLPYVPVIGTCYKFTIYDEYGDGICCTYGDGSYSVYNSNSLYQYAQGSEFEDSEQTDFCIGYVTSSIAEEEANLSVFPNPSLSHQIQLEINSTEEIEKIEIFDQSGRIIYLTNHSLREIDLTNLKNGNYFIRISTKNKSYTKLLSLI